MVLKQQVILNLPHFKCIFLKISETIHSTIIPFSNYFGVHDLLLRDDKNTLEKKTSLLQVLPFLTGTTANLQYCPLPSVTSI